MKIPKVPLPRVKITPLAVKGIVTAYFRTYSNNPDAQEKFLFSHIKKNTTSAFGEVHHFDQISSVKDFQKLVDVQHYDSMYPWIERSMRGEKNVLLQWPIKRFATSSGTTGKNKYIPVTKAALKKNHYRAGTDILMYYAKSNPESTARQGPCLGIGGGFSFNPFTGKQNVGYISAIIQKEMPFLAKLRKQPSSKISYLADWQHKVKQIIKTTSKKNITIITAQPSWWSSYLEKLIETTWAQSVLDIRPNFSLFIWGGMAIDLHKPIFKKLFPWDQVKYYQAYNASEGFFAVQHENNRDDMILLVNHAVFYEFIPFENYLRKDYSICLTLREVEIGKPYVILITNNSWLRRYVLWDVVEFTWTDPYTIKLIGRTKYYIDVASECTPFGPIDEAIRETATHFDGTIKDYTVWPGMMARVKEWHYEILIERTIPPLCTPEEFSAYFDLLLCKKRGYYNDERHDTHMLQVPITKFLPNWTFYNRLKTRGKLWWQHKVPRVANDRTIINQIYELL